MLGSLCVWWWNGLRARRAQWRRAFIVAAVAAPVLCASPAALANPDQQGSEQRDGQSRHESGVTTLLTLSTPAGAVHVDRMFLIQSTVVGVSETSPGVEFESLDRLDVSGVPLLGSLFERPLQVGDLTEANRVGTVYSAGEGALAAVLDESVKLAGLKLGVVNGKGRFNLVAEPRVLQVGSSDLGSFGNLRSVQTVLAGTASPNTTVVLGRLTQKSVPAGELGVPVLAEIPLLQSLFRGTVHQRDENELLVLIKPSVIVREEE